MKKIFLFFIISGALFSCKPKIEGELGDPSDKLAGINGKWQLSSFSQRDENNPIKEVRDISQFYIIDDQEATTITFDSETRTYDVVPGPGKNFFGTGGNWHFDDDGAPTTLYLEGSDTLSLKLGSVPRESEIFLSLELPRFCVDPITLVAAPTVTYIFKIERIQ